MIEQCTLNASGNIILTCDQNEVIYAPEFSVAGHTRHNPSCNFGRYPCGGHTIMSLVQRNSCFWKNDCHVSWKDPLPILMSKSPSCIGYMASIIGMYGHRCVPKGMLQFHEIKLFFSGTMRPTAYIFSMKQCLVVPYINCNCTSQTPGVQTVNTSLAPILREN